VGGQVPRMYLMRMNTEFLSEKELKEETALEI
jgi:hypothetical protein